MNKIILLVTATIIFTGCTRTDSAMEVLKDAGYTNIEITGYRFFGCSDDDHFHTGFKALGPSGHPTEGVVCQGVLKGSTIRFD